LSFAPSARSRGARRAWHAAKAGLPSFGGHLSSIGEA
jgi:hypothetical protein